MFKVQSTRTCDQYHDNFTVCNLCSTQICKSCCRKCRICMRVTCITCTPVCKKCTKKMCDKCIYRCYICNVTLCNSVIGECASSHTCELTEFIIHSARK